MITVVIIVAVISLALGLYSYRNSRSTKEDIRRLNAKLDAMNKGKSADDMLCPAGIEDAVRSLGCITKTSDGVVHFAVSEDNYIIDTTLLPKVFIYKMFRVDRNQYDIGRLNLAAHLMSDSIPMVKAIADEEDPEKPSLSIILVAQDANYASFSTNLVQYLSYMNDGENKIREIYEDLRKNNDDEEYPAVSPSINGNQRKVVS